MSFKILFWLLVSVVGGFLVWRAIRLAVACGLWAYGCVINVRDWWRAQLRRWKAQWVALCRRLRAWLHSLLRPLLHAATYVLMALVTAVTAPSLFLFFGRLIGGLKPGFLHDAAVNALVAVVSGFALAIAVSMLRGQRVALAEKLLDRLAGRVTPDGGHKVAAVDFWPMSPDWRDGIITRHYGIEIAPKRASEWLVVLHQVGGAYRGSHSLFFLKSQIEALERRRREAKQDWEAASRYGGAHCPPPPPPPEPKWVCFVSLNGRFHAMQPWKVFRYQIITKENAAYERLLNASSEVAFAQEIDKNMKRNGPQTDTEEEPQFFSDAIPGLECFWIEADTTNENALKILAVNTKARAMVVHDCAEGGPWGIITLGSLADTVFFKLLKNFTLTGGQQAEGRCGTGAPGFGLPEKATTPP